MTALVFVGDKSAIKPAGESYTVTITATDGGGATFRATLPLSPMARR